MQWHYFRWALRIALFGAATVGVAALTLGGMLAVPLRQAPELASISAGVRQVDRSDLPELQRFQARDGTELAYRVYQPATEQGERIAVLVHGSAGNSVNMHAVGKALAAAGVRAVAVDIRGHGRSGTRGDIAYAGQLDDDLTDMVKHLKVAWPRAALVLVGHSSGGGFALRVAGGVTGDQFERYVLLAPYLDPFAATARPSSDRSNWALPDIPRIVGINLLQKFGITCCGHLPVVAFALPAGSALRATGRYSFALMTNFGTGMDHRIFLDRVRRPMTVIAGADDELMYSDRYADVMRRPGLDLKTVIIPNVDHMGVVAAPTAIEAIVAALKS